MQLGLTSREFFDLTPRQYHLLLDQDRARLKHDEWQTGILAAAIVNWSMSRPEEPVKPSDFALPLLRSDLARSKRKRIDRKKIAAQIRAAFDAAMEAQKQRQPRPPR